LKLGRHLAGVGSSTPAHPSDHHRDGRISHAMGIAGDKLD